MGTRPRSELRPLLLVMLSALASCACGACGALTSDRNDPSGASDLEAAVSKDETSAIKPTWARPAAPAIATCAQPTSLLVHHDAAGRVDRLHAQLTAQEVDGFFLIDTGSVRSFVAENGTDDSEAAKTTDTTVSCTSLTLPIIARPLPATTLDGRRQAGVLGVDLFREGSVLDLDLVRGLLRWSIEPTPKAPPGAVIVPIEMRKGWLVASGIRLGGRDVKLVVDTGTTNVVYVGDEARPNEVEEETVDGTASPITLFHGSGEIAFPDGVTRSVPVDRSPDFVTLRGLIAELGPDVVGLLGITALGRERIVIGPDSMTLLLPRDLD